MSIKPRVFSSALSPTQRRIYGTVTIVFIATFLATMWPVYPLFNRVRPSVLGIPASLAYLVALVFVSFFSLFGLYRWESRRQEVDRATTEDEAD